MNPSSSAFYNALIKRPSERSDEDVSTIFNHLRRLDVFERLHDAPLRSVCRTARLERHPANYVLFRKGQLATCWYILLSGSVFMNKQVYLPIGCFGKRSNMNLRRMSDCIVISPSDMIVIDYPDVQRITVQLNSTSGSSMASSGGQTSTSSTAFPVVHPNLVPSFSSSSGMAGSVDNLIPAGPRKQNGFSRLSTSHQPQRFPTHSTMNSNQQHLQSPQKQFVFHRFPQTGPPAPSSSTLNPASHPWQNNIVNHVGHAQMPIASASISHRVPSPAPTNCTSHPIRASPTKSLHHYQQNQPARHHGTIAQKQHQPQCTSYQHAKCNSLSETSATNAMPANNQKQQNSTMNFTNGPYSHEIEVPFVRANHSAQQLQQRTAFGRMNQQQPLQQLSKQTVPEEQLQQEHFSPPRPPRTTHFVRAMTAGNSVVQQKKCLFEPTTSTTAIQIGHAEKDLEEEGEHTGTMKRREEPVNNGGNSSTLTRQNAKEKPLEISHDTEPLESMAMPPPASNFQRLSKIRLNMNGGRKSQQQQQQPPHCQQQHQPNGNSALSTTGMNGGQQLQLANVRIRQQSPQHRQTAPNGYQQQQANKLANQIRQSTASSTSAMTGEESDCFAGLPETAVDSEGPEGDEEDDDEEEDEEGSCPSHDSFQELRDSVRECLEKEPSQRGAEDLAVLIEFMASLPALASLPMGIKRQLCEKMVFAVVPHKGTTIMQHGERIDAWSVVVNGAVEHVHSNGQRAEYRVGDCFGVQSVAQAQYNDGEIRTLADDCEFVLVEHGDFYSIMSTLSRHVERENDNTGEVVREVERRMVDNQVELVITKASPDRLLRQLLVDDELLASAGDVAQMDSHFVEDFLLMHRVFFPDSGLIVRQLIDWFRAEPKHRDRVARIMLIWMNNHFEDFEANDVNGKMTALLNEFEELLGEAKMYNHQSLLSITCSVKSQPRQITLTRSNRAEPLQFQLIDGSSGGIYVLSADPDSSAQKMGLKRADEILEVNGQDFRKFSLAKAEELMRESTHLSITLKTNWIGFKEALQQDQVDSGPVFRPSANPTAQSSAGTSAMPSRYQKKSSAPMIGGSIGYQQQRERRSTLSAALNQSELHPQHYQQQHIKAGSATPTGSMSGAVSSKKVLNKLLHMIRGSSGSGHLHLPASIDEAAIHHQHQQQQQNQQMVESSDEVLPLTVGLGGTLRASRSNPDISAHSLAAGALGSYSSNASSSCSSSHRHSSLCTNSGNNAGLIQADQVLKVYRSDQSFRYIPVCADTNAKQLVHLALQEFGIPIESGGKDCCWWALYECSVSAEGVIRQKRLPDNASNLAEKIGLNARLYLRDLQKGESTLLPDELIPEVLKQARLTLYTLNAQCIATQLTLQDFTVFASIEPTEYVNHLFQLADDDNPCASNRHRGWSRLAEFEALFNREMWWVATEVCCERNIYRRSKLVKKFIKIARHCHMLRNLNSMFAIVSGLEKPAVRRLAHTWERVPGKYLKMLTDLQQLMDPSRNMSRYRQHLAQLAQEPPLLPIYPILRKDLTFAHEANPTFCGPRLVNFEKLRMIAQIVRSIQHFSSVHYDPMELVIGSGIGGMSELAEPGTIRKGGHGMMAGMASRFGGSSGSGGGLSRKKLYERTLMLRRVRAYLQAMPIIDSEVELDRLSLECEPATLSAAPSSSVQQLHVQGASSSSTARRRLPSPSPSSMSSQSSQSVQHPGQHRLPKFGVESPQAVQKMLSLVQNSKIKARNPLQHPSIGRSQLHHSFGGISVSAELPPIASDQRKRGSVTSNSTNAEENGNQNNTSSNNNNQNQPNNIATERAI